MGFWVVVIASLLLLFLWGVLSPRGQWRVLASWTYRDPLAAEPGPVAIGLHRLLSAIGLGFFGVVGAISLANYLAELPPPPPTLSLVQQMWGVAPAPQVIDRIVQPAAEPLDGLVQRPVEGYQVVDNVTDHPRYLHLLRHVRDSGGTVASGLIGTAPGKNFTALDSAELVVNVRAWIDCIPRQAVVVETETTVQVAVYYGLRDRADGSIPNHAECDRAPFIQLSALLPLNLAEPLGDRELQTLEGVPIPEVAVLTE